MPSKFWLSGLVSGLLLMGCNSPNQTDPLSTGAVQESRNVLAGFTIQEKRVIRSGNGFGFSLLALLAADDQEGNLFISPLNVATALSMANNGAGGSTSDAISTVLGFSDQSRDSVNVIFKKLLPAFTGADPKVQINFANSIWYADDLHPEPAFLDLNQSVFRSTNRAVAFPDPSTPSLINGWVALATGNRITTMVEPHLDPSTQMMLLSAVYFKGTWSRAFDPNQTRNAAFHLADGSLLNCAMMNEEAQFSVLRDSTVTGVELPYGDSLFTMDFLQPNDATAMPTLIKDLQNGAWEQWQNQLHPWAGRVSVPKFKLEYGLSLVDALTKMGMGGAFTQGADFTGIRKSGGLALGDVIHKTAVTLDETGTEAAAVTRIDVVDTVAITEEIRFDRPFLCLIREKTTGAVIFLGRIMAPAL